MKSASNGRWTRVFCQLGRTLSRMAGPRAINSSNNPKNRQALHSDPCIILCGPRFSHRCHGRNGPEEVQGHLLLLTMGDFVKGRPREEIPAHLPLEGRVLRAISWPRWHRVCTLGEGDGCAGLLLVGEGLLLVGEAGPLRSLPSLPLTSSPWRDPSSPPHPIHWPDSSCQGQRPQQEEQKQPWCAGVASPLPSHSPSLEARSQEARKPKTEVVFQVRGHLTHMYVHAHTHTHTPTHTYAHMLPHTQRYTPTRSSARAHTQTHLHRHTPPFTCAHTHTFLRTHTPTLPHTQTHSNTFSYTQTHTYSRQTRTHLPSSSCPTHTEGLHLAFEWQPQNSRSSGNTGPEELCRAGGEDRQGRGGKDRKQGSRPDSSSNDMPTPPQIHTALTWPFMAPASTWAAPATPTIFLWSVSPSLLPWDTRATTLMTSKNSPTV